VRTLVVGVGNPIRGDDAVGPVVAEQLCRLLGPQCEFLPLCGSGMDLLGWVDGYERMVVIDAMQDERLQVGECCALELPGAHTRPLDLSSHRASVLDVLALAPRWGVRLPAEVRWYGVGVRLRDEFSDGLSEQLRACVPAIVQSIRRDLERGSAPEGVALGGAS
jgi:hydrogenase maturation protease